MTLRGKIISHSKTVTLAATPEEISPAGVSLLTPSAVIQAKSSNTVACFIGDSASQDLELVPGASISIADLFNDETKLAVDLFEIFCKVGVNGEGINVLRTKVLS